MALELHPVDLAAERKPLLSLLQRNLPELDHARRFDWLYLNNPAGRAWAWFLRVDGMEAPVGVASVFPRPVWLGAQVRTSGHVGDFAVDAAYRSLGPAVLLQRATFGPVDEGALAFCYDCPPHDKGIATFRRLGMSPSCRMLRHAKPLRVDRVVRRHVRLAALASATSWLGNAALRAWRRPRFRTHGIEVAVHSGPFGEEFSELDGAIGGLGTIRGRRSADELNWRYRDDPLHEYVVIVARRAGRLLAFASLLVSGADAFLVDLFGRSLPDVAVPLTAAATDMLRRTNVQTLHAFASDRSGLAELLRSVGFRYRSAGPHVVAYAAAKSDIRAALDTHAWDLMLFDVGA